MPPHFCEDAWGRMIDCESPAVFRERFAEHDASHLTTLPLVALPDGLECTTTEDGPGRDLPIGRSMIVALVTDDPAPITARTELRCPHNLAFETATTHHGVGPFGDARHAHEFLVRIVPTTQAYEREATLCAMIVGRVGEQPLSAHWNVFPETDILAHELAGSLRRLAQAPYRVPWFSHPLQRATRWPPGKYTRVACGGDVPRNTCFISATL